MLNVKIKILSSYFIRKSISLDYKSYKYISSSINLLSFFFVFCSFFFLLYNVVVAVSIQAFSCNNRQPSPLFSFRSHKSNGVLWYWEACKHKNKTKKKPKKNEYFEAFMFYFANAYASKFRFCDICGKSRCFFISKFTQFQFILWQCRFKDLFQICSSHKDSKLRNKKPC